MIWKKNKAPKYRNIKRACLSRHEHDSIFEANYCNRLLAMQQKGEIVSYAVQVPFDLTVNGVLVCRHNVDFLVRIKDGLPVVQENTEVHEAKGIRTAAWSIKRKLFQALFPGIKYVIIQKRIKPWGNRKTSSPRQ